MTDITKEKMKDEIFKFLNNGGDRKVLKQRINGIGSKEFSREFKEFVNLNNPTHTTNNTRESSPGVTVNVYNSNSSVLDNPFFWLWLSSSSSHSHHSHSNSSGYIGDFSSGGDGDGEGCCIFIIIIVALAALCINAFVSYKVCEALEESKNNGDKLLGSISAFVVQAAISAGLIFFIIKANEIVFNKGRVELYQMLAGINAIISGIACFVFLAFVIIASYERYQNGKVAREYANLAMEKLRSIDENSSDNISSPGTEDITSKPSASPHPPGFINDLTQEVTSMPSSTEEENPKPSAPPWPSELSNSLNIEEHHGGMMPENPILF